MDSFSNYSIGLSMSVVYSQLFNKYPLIILEKCMDISGLLMDIPKAFKDYVCINTPLIAMECS